MRWCQNRLFKADICKVGDHYFRFIEDTGVTSYYLKHYEALKHKADGHRFGRKDQRAKKFMNSFRLVDELMKNKAKLLEDAPYDLIREFRSEKIDPEKVYDFNVPSCCEPIENPANKEHKPKAPPINIYFDCETYTTKRFKHIPYLVCLKSDEESQPFKSKYCFGKLFKNEVLHFPSFGKWISEMLRYVKIVFLNKFLIFCIFKVFW